MAARKPAKQRRLERFTELTRQMKADPDVLMIVHNWCAKLDVPNNNVGLLAQEHPGQFDLMCRAIDDLLDQAPTEARAPWT
jgi:hypothetical protein